MASKNGFAKSLIRDPNSSMQKAVRDGCMKEGSVCVGKMLMSAECGETVLVFWRVVAIARDSVTSVY